MTLGYALFTVGAMFIYTAIKNMSLRDIVLDRPGPGQPDDIVDLSGGGSGGAGTGGKGGGGAMNLKGGGKWGGAQKIVEDLADGLGLSVLSTKRDTQLTDSGGVSDHWSGCKKCYALDLGGTTAELDKAARKLAKRLGNNRWSGGSWLTVNKAGFRIQVGWRVPDHAPGDNPHIHLGARALGYTP